MPAAPSAIEDLKQDDENLDSLVLADDEIDWIFSEPKINILQDQNEEGNLQLRYFISSKMKNIIWIIFI